jgi:hypothetical protein
MNVIVYMRLPFWRSPDPPNAHMHDVSESVCASVPEACISIRDQQWSKK